MIPSLFPADHYGSDFESEWREYNGPKSGSKRDANKAYIQTRLYRPRHEIMLLVFQEYAEDRRKTKQAQCHLATFYRSHKWEGYLADAIWRFEHPVEITPARAPFTASQYGMPERPATRSAAEILSGRQK